MTVLKTSMRNFFAHKGRMALSAVAVLLSVAFVCGTLVFTDTMNTTFDKLFAATSSDVTVSPKDASDSGETTSDTGRPPVLPASVVGKVRGAEGVKSAEGTMFSSSVTVVDADKDSLSPTSGAPTIVGSWNGNDARTMKITGGAAPKGADQIMVDADTADKHHLKLGDEISVISATGTHSARISGFAAFTVTNPGAAIFYLDTATAQKTLVGRTGVFTSINVTAAAGVTDPALKKNVLGALGTGYKVQTAKEVSDANQKELSGFLDVMKYAMLGFAGVAFLVGIFLIINTFSMLVAQRTREIGLMRAIGSSRRQVNRSVLVEALLLGVVGSVLGVAAGVGIAVGLMKVMGSVGMKLSTDDLTVAWTTPVAGIALGVIVTVLAAYLPARRAGKVSPMAALRDAGAPADARAGRVRAVLGILLTGAGAVSLYATSQAGGATEGSAWLGLGVVLTLIGFVVVGPLLASGVVRVLGTVLLRPLGSVGRMAERNALRNPRRTGATGAALMIGLALVACLSVVGSSMVASATDQLDKTVGTDFIIQSDSGQLITPEAVKAVKSVPGMERVTEYRVTEADYTTPDGKTLKDTDITAADPTYAEDVRTKTVAGDIADAYKPDSMSVNEKFAEDHGVRLGSKIKVDFKDGSAARLTVRAITSDDVVIDKGAMYTSTATLAKYVPADRMPLDVVLFGSSEEGQQDAAYKALKAELHDYPQYTVRDQTDYKQELKDQIGQLLNLIYGLLALAIIVAVLGVVNTLALSVVERTREIGLMRAIGLSRRQLRRMIRLESVVIALFGALLGLGLGMGWGASAQKLLALEGLKVLDIPWPTIIGVFVGSAFVGLFAALVPAFRAGRMNVLTAIATE
ncbi:MULTISPECIES: ABC transporter permease [Streptomyces]|jgi:putative ABC transport system permease protein|uniref:ABC transporter transmembrane subunit n=3 Tax=Streptomyces griseoaurantiacus TaxID=68213 RepID=F3NS20_9ACTN|nr:MULTISPECIES: FtsX-like permease family protein [Streptomyces]EGG43593.1 ABC transporter transmembrane subunit [Streptomyces griseoaurantiacus M045]MBA5226161.1 FtsX-like permease family protein [Streptomyces griseoaurantiacus]MCF0090307.1 ABC transporter permease YtrF [Streptomyces sp. MH192]MCF0102860.1 ABC transporter permease YtrF [Streptomyces sp. MH191]MDX3089006.1 FtsX-like permease family protein [Streptomyces sp. ME12-02E]